MLDIRRGRARILRLCAAGFAIGAVGATAPPMVAAASVTQNDNASFSVTAGSLTFGTPAPNVPDTLSSVTLNGTNQTSNGQMNNFQVVDATGSGAGWNLTVNGNSGTGLSPVFRRYCPNSSCGSDTGGPGYIGTVTSLPAGSLTLSSTGATLTGGSGSAPTNQCATACTMDTSAPTKIVSAATNGGMGTWTESGFGSSSVVVAVPSSIQVLNSGEYYRVDLLWTLGTGP